MCQMYAWMRSDEINYEENVRWWDRAKCGVQRVFEQDVKAMEAAADAGADEASPPLDAA